MFCSVKNIVREVLTSEKFFFYRQRETTQVAERYEGGHKFNVGLILGFYFTEFKPLRDYKPSGISNVR